MESPIVEEWSSQDGRLAYWLRRPNGKRELVVTKHELGIPAERLNRIRQAIEREVSGVS